MNIDEFERFRAAGYTRIPVHVEMLADLENPLTAFLKLANQPYSFLFESVQGGEKWSRYSIVGLPSQRRLEVHNHTITEIEAGEIVQTLEADDPLAWIDEYQRQFKLPELAGLPTVTGGLVGYFGYDTVRLVEPRLGANTHPDPLGTPDILLMVADELLVLDNLSGKLHVLVLADATQEHAFGLAQERLGVLVRQLKTTNAVLPNEGEGQPLDESAFVSEMGEAEFKKAVLTIKDYITAGECMQVVLSHRMSAPFTQHPLNLYRALRTTNPSPYMFYLDLGDHHVVGASPEILVRVEDDVVTVRPIAGTRPRGKDESEDRALEADLLADEKEIAEHLMLIDLGRNDVGRIAQIGSVDVTEEFNIERYSHVMHIVSNVEGKLKAGASPMDVLRATFPAGTLSGAPKVRALEILQELETVKRGVYSGAVGYLSWNGNMDTAIAIRTAVVKDQHLHVQAGAGVVYDSNADSEWIETLNKARAVMRAADLAEQGLDELPDFIDAGNNPMDLAQAADASETPNGSVGGAA